MKPRNFPRGDSEHEEGPLRVKLPSKQLRAKQDEDVWPVEFLSK